MLVTHLAVSKPYRRKDPYFLKAKSKGLRARSAFKIEEIVRRFDLVRAGSRVLDLGAAPGGFLEILSQIVGPKGFVLGVDRVPIPSLPNASVRTAVVDLLSEDWLSTLRAIHGGPFDAVISDLAPKTSGIRSTDESRSQQLAQRALEAVLALGRPGSSFVVKLFMGSDFERFRQGLREYFEEVRVVRPLASRPGSMEIYLVGRRRRAKAGGGD